MNFEEFKTSLLNDLKTNNINCLKYIDKNSGSIKNLLLNDNADDELNDLLNGIIEIILNTEKKKYDLIEKVLTHTTLTVVYNRFKNSEVLIEAYKRENIKAIKWLLKLNLNYCVQDKDGVSALMLSVRNYIVPKAVSRMIDADKNCILLTDNNGDNALFYSYENLEALKTLLDTNTYDINYKNRNGETFLIHCCKQKNLDSNSFKLIMVALANQCPSLDPNRTDDTGKTALMYLAESGKSNEIRSLYYRFKTIFVNYKNKLQQSALSLVINNMYVPVETGSETETEREEEGTSEEEKMKNKNKNKNNPFFSSYLNTIKVLLEINYNFNIPIDEEGNTAIMIFIMVNDFNTLKYVLKNNSHIDLTQENNYGENAISLCFKCKNSNYLYILLKSYPSFSYDYRDRNNGNNLVMLASMNSTIVSSTLEEVISKSGEDALNAINTKKENALILATKLRCKKNVSVLLKKKDIMLYQQDELGNTALHYAIDLQDEYLIKLLLAHHADIHLKNDQGKSPLDYVDECVDKIFSNKIRPFFSGHEITDLSDEKKEEEKEKEEEEEEEDIISSNTPWTMAKYKETSEYLNPWINDRYQHFEMNKSLETIEQVIYFNDPYSAKKLY
eukprot:jgi/Orpsp1_1/1192401/evm.model.d7180000092928.1